MLQEKSEPEVFSIFDPIWAVKLLNRNFITLDIYLQLYRGRLDGVFIATKLHSLNILNKYNISIDISPELYERIILEDLTPWIPDQFYKDKQQVCIDSLTLFIYGISVFKNFSCKENIMIIRKW